MKLTNLSALSFAIMMVSATQANHFIEDSSLDIHTKNYYKHDTTENIVSTTTNRTNDNHTQWVQAVSIIFQSGYYKNILGLDLGNYHSFKIRGDDGSTNGLLRPSTRDDDVNSYGKISYALKVNLMDMGTAKYGRMFIDTPLLKNTKSKVLPSLTEGFYAEGSFNELDLYGLIAFKENTETQSGFNSYGYTDGGDTHSKHVQIIGGGYNFGHGITTNIAFGQQKDVAQRYFADLNYSTMIAETKLDFGFQYAKNSASGFSKDSIKNDNNLIDKDTSQNVWGAKIAANFDAFTLGLDYTSVEKTDMGAYQHAWGMTESSSMQTSGATSGYFGYNSMMYGDFNRNGQKSWGFTASYDFDRVIEGIKLSTAYVTGKVNPAAVSGNRNPDSWTEKEYNVGLSYNLPMIEGLSTSIIYAHNTQEDQGFNSSNQISDAVRIDTRVMVEYDISIF